MYNYINEEVEIDKATLPKDLRRLAEECENADLEDNYGLYENLVQILIDVNGKEAYRLGHITRKTWNDLERRYEL